MGALVSEIAKVHEARACLTAQPLAGCSVSRRWASRVDDGFREHLAITQEYSLRWQPTAVAMDGRAL
jgi:hypothetical protein